MLAKARKGLAFMLALMMILCVFPMRAFAEDTSEESKKLPYEGSELAFYKEDLASTFGMLTPQEGSKCELKGDKVVIHIVPKNTTVYNAMHWGYITEELTSDVKFNEDGTIDMELSAEEYCGYAHAVAPIKAAGGTTKDQYYLAIPAADKLQPAEEEPTEEDPTAEEPTEEDPTVEEPTEEDPAAEEPTEEDPAAEEPTEEDPAAEEPTEEDPAAEEPTEEDPAAEEPTEEDPAAEEPAERFELATTNNTGMFKVVTASIETAKDGGRTLVFALSGTGYENLFKGTYEQAKANGNDRSKWIEGQKNEEGKLEFRITLEDGETYIPLVAISKSYLGKYEEDPEHNNLERAFYPRQIELDLDAKTLVSGDYENSEELTITNNVKMFKPKSAALTTVGGPNSNNYSTTLDFLYDGDAFSKAFIGKASEADSEGIEIVEASDRLFSFKLKWIETVGDPDSVVNLMDEPFVVSFYSVKNEKWYEREFTVDESGLTLTINEAPEEEDTPAEDDVIVSISDKNGKNYSFKCEAVPDDVILTKAGAARVNDKVDDPEGLEILWQKDVVVPDDTEFPVTLVFNVDEDHKGMKIFIYHYDREKKAWEVVGEGSGETVEVTMDKLSPVAMVAQKEESPATGDTSRIGLWTVMTVCSVTAAGMLLFARRRRIVV